MGTCICYAGIVWINQKSISEIERTWYKVLKAATGAVFNIKRTTAETLLGVLPLQLQNRVNSVKHMLKLNILPPRKDPLKELICNQLASTSRYSRVTWRVKEVFQFLKWKQSRVPNQFTTGDMAIIDGNKFDKFGELSQIACSYTKPVIRRYSEVIWQTQTNNHNQLDGFQEAPLVSTKKLEFPQGTSRIIETLTMSLFYPNNLLASFLHRFDPIKFPKAQCECGKGEQTALHLLLGCWNVDLDKRWEVDRFLAGLPVHSLAAVAVQKELLISWSRLPGFLKLCTEAIEETSEFLTVDVILQP